VLFLALTVSDVCSGSTGEDACHFSQSFMFNLLRTEYVVAASRVKMVCVVCVVCVCQSGCVHGVYGGREGEGDVCMHTCTRIYAYMHLCVYVCMHLSIVQPVAYRVRLTESVTCSMYDDVT